VDHPYKGTLCQVRRMYDHNTSLPRRNQCGAPTTRSSKKAASLPKVVKRLSHPSPDDRKMDDELKIHKTKLVTGVISGNDGVVLRGRS
jgi:hypothetical protein